MSRLLHISASPRGAAVGVAGDRRDVRSTPTARPTRDVVDHFDLWDGTLPAFGPAAVGAKMAVFAGGEPAGRAGRRVAGRPARPSTASTPPTATCSASRCGTPASRTSSSSSSTSCASPAWSSASIPNAATRGLPARQEGRRHLHQRRVRGRPRPPAFGSDFQAPFLEDWLRWAGITDIRAIEFRPEPRHRRRRDRTPRGARRGAGTGQALLTIGCWRRNGREGNT